MRALYLIGFLTMSFALTSKADNSCKSRITEELQKAKMGTYDRPESSKTFEKFDSKTIFSKYQMLADDVDKSLNTSEVAEANKNWSEAEKQEPRNEKAVKEAKSKYIFALDKASKSKISKDLYAKRDRFYKNEIKFSNRSELNRRGKVFDSIVTFFNKQGRKFDVFLNEGKIIAYDSYADGKAHLLVELDDSCKIQMLSSTSCAKCGFPGKQITPKLCKSPSFSSNRIKNFSDMIPGSFDGQQFLEEIRSSGVDLPFNPKEEEYKAILNLCDGYKENLADTVVGESSHGTEHKKPEAVR